MSASKSKKPVAISQQQKRYPTAKLLKSRALAEYQQDFAGVILTEPEYTIEEAKAELDRVLKG